MNVRGIVNIWLAVLDFAGLITLYEIGAEETKWWHTISYISYYHNFLGWVIAVMMASVLGWWILHFHRKHEQ